MKAKRLSIALGLMLILVMAFNMILPLPSFGSRAFALDVEAGKEISIIQKADTTYTVQGLVVAKNSRAVVITDGVDGVMIYGSGVLQVADLGDFIEVTATSSKYNGLLQLSYNSETIVTKLDTTPPTEKAAETLTPNRVNEWKTKAEADTLSVSDVQRYSWQATATRVGSYWALTPSFVTDFQIEPLYVSSAQFTLEEGTNYDVVGYFIGANMTSSTPYAGIMIEELNAVAGQVEVTVAKEYVALRYAPNTTVDLGVDIKNTTNKNYNVESSNTTVATWDALNEKVNLVGAGTTTITVSWAEDETKTATVVLVAYSEPLESPADVEEGTYQVRGTVVAKTTSSAIVADEYGGVMVYDVKQVSQLSVGDVVSVAGTLSKYNGLWQFSYNPGVVVEKTGATAPIPTDFEQLTETKLEGWQSATSLSQEDVKLYHWTAVAGLRNSFNVYSLSYNGIAVESAEALEGIVLGKTYDIEGYFAGYNTNNDYASFVISHYEEAATQQDYIGFNRDTINLGLNTTYTLNPFVGGTITADSVKYTVEDPTVVGLDEETKVITGLKAGTTTITASAGTITRTLTVHVDSSIGQITQSGQFYTVIGKVVAITEQSMVIHDGTDGILVFGRNAIAGVTKGQYVQVSGTISTYNNMLQFNNPTVDITEQTVPDGEITPLTASIADGRAAERTTPFPVSACQGYSWTATVQEKDGFLTINFEGSNTVIEPVYYPATATPQLEAGKTYNIVGYFVGYSTSNGYAAIAIESATLVS